MTLRGGALRLGGALGLAALALLPIADWIPGGHSIASYPLLLAGWWSGTLLAVGIGAILAVLSRSVPGLWRAGRWTALTDRAALLTPVRSALVALVATLLYAFIATEVFGRHPLLIDEIIQVWQAHVYATGRLSLPSTGAPDLFGAMHLVDHAGKVFGQFPPGGSAMLALGSLVHAEWLVGPLFAGVGVFSWAAVLRHTAEPAPAATNALFLLAFAPFALFMSASHMNHVTTLAWIVVGMAGLAFVTSAPRPRLPVAFGLGLAFGIAATIRPVDGLAFGAPAGFWLFARALRDRTRVGECLVAGAGMLLPVAVMLWINAQTTGHPLLFGYTLLWGPGHDLGFHSVPWGAPHTPLRGLELVNIYLLNLQTFFLETPFPALLPALGAFLLARRLSPFDRYLSVSAVFLAGLYFAYWHDGEFLGPRFFYPLLPVISLWTARFGSAIVERSNAEGLAVRTWVFTALAGAVMALATAIPARAAQYRALAETVPWPSAAPRNGVVLVRESWGSQTIARMWGLGISRGRADGIYKHTDLCVLATAIDRLERTRIRGTAAEDSLLPLTADSARLVSGRLSADHSESLLPGAVYSADCLARLQDDRAGFTVIPPFLLDDQSGNLYVRDLHARDTLALQRYPDRPIYLLAPPDTVLGRTPIFRPIARNSLMRDWGLPIRWGRDR